MAYPFLISQEKYAGRGLRPCSKKPGTVFAGAARIFGEYSFLEDSRYTSQEVCGAI
jgi:hypothetical protein